MEFLKQELKNLAKNKWANNHTQKMGKKSYYAIFPKNFLFYF